ncbi:hypothetical protein VTN00DRAFT_3466 [Thermoascus crustaceus]|uniref:uncharacterized protein n=1 Tax=Thermoascus crustaceus TaxID=5088 RepID=UPI00374348AD
MLLSRLVLQGLLVSCIPSTGCAGSILFAAGSHGFISPAIIAAATTAAGENHLLPKQSPATDPDNNQIIEIDGFYFENPSTKCTYASQPYIYKVFSNIDKNVENLFGLIHPNATFTVVGHHPLAGRYHDLKHFYINALYRIYNCARLKYPELYKGTLQYIHAGCDERWSVQELLFEGKANNGLEYKITNVWVTRWEDGKMVEVRTYVDADDVSRMLFDNEIWSNSSTFTEHDDFMPGPAGMPPDKETPAVQSSCREHY